MATYDGGGYLKFSKNEASKRYEGLVHQIANRNNYFLSSDARLLNQSSRYFKMLPKTLWNRAAGVSRSTPL